MSDVEAQAKPTEERESDLQKDSKQTVARWLRELDASEQHERKWRERAEKIVKLYADQRERSESDDPQYRFGILYANTEVLKGALYSQCPAPDVRRRFLDRDPVGRVAALVLMRALVASLDKENGGEDFDALMKSAVFDMTVPGRAAARVKYVPTVADEEVVYESVESEYIEWAFFRIAPAKRWRKVRWVAWGELLTRDDLVKQFGEKIGKAVELKWMPKGMEDSEENRIFKRALVWTIWNKTDRKVYVVSEGYKEAPLTVQDDPLKLEGFFPVPRPLYSIYTTDSLIPIPEYTVYQDHAIQLDEINERIAVLTDALRRRGVYDKSVPELAELAALGDNKFVAIADYRSFVEKGGLQQLFQEQDISGLAAVLKELMLQAEAKKAQIYEIIGISDIMRGATDANETATAQRAKNQWGSIRVQPRQAEVQRFARDLIRIKAEIIAEHFSPQTLSTMTGISLAFTAQERAALAQTDDPRAKRPTWEEVMQVLRSDKLRGFRVDIETDSTIKPRADDEQKNRVDLLTGVTSFLEKSLPAVQMGMIPKKVAGELLMFGVRAFAAGPQLEEALDEWAFEGGIDGEEQQMPPEMAQLQQQNQQLQATADEAQLKREEMGVKREELGLKREEIAGRKAEMQMGHEQAMAEREAQTSAMVEQRFMPAMTQLTQAVQALVQGQQQLAQMMQQMHAESCARTDGLHQVMMAPKEIIRGPDGKAQGARVVMPRMQ